MNAAMARTLAIVVVALVMPVAATAEDSPRFVLELDLGPVWQSRNDVQVPNDARDVTWHETFDDGWQDRWQLQRLASRATEFLASTYDGEAVLRVRAHRSAAALVRPVNGGGTPEVISWRWLLDQGMAVDPGGMAEETQREGDDYAARVFVIFGDDLTDDDTRVLCYVWARQLDPGVVFPSPVADRVRMIVLRSKNDAMRVWRTERIDPAADYRRIFGGEPPPVGGIALMSDTDDTESSAAVLFDDVVVGAAQ